MPHTIAVEIDTNGHIRLLAPTQQLPAGLAILTLLPIHSETTLLAESALADDWLRPEEDAAWTHLQPGK